MPHGFGCPPDARTHEIGMAGVHRHPDSREFDARSRPSSHRDRSKRVANPGIGIARIGVEPNRAEPVFFSLYRELYDVVRSILGVSQSNAHNNTPLESEPALNVFLGIARTDQIAQSPFLRRGAAGTTLTVAT